MINLMMLPALRKARLKNKENQFFDFRVMITKEEKPRFFLLSLSAV